MRTCCSDLRTRMHPVVLLHNDLFTTVANSGRSIGERAVRAIAAPLPRVRVVSEEFFW